MFTTHIHSMQFLKADKLSSIPFVAFIILLHQWPQPARMPNNIIHPIGAAAFS